MTAVSKRSTKAAAQRKRKKSIASESRFLSEVLEDRTLFSTFTWNAALDGALWSSPSSWTVTGGSGTIPGSADTVVFNGTSTHTSVMGGTFSISQLQMSAAYTGQLSLGSNTLSVSSGVTVANASEFNAGTSLVNLTGGETVSCAATLNNLQLNVGYPNIVTLSQNLNVLGNLTITALAGMNGTGTLNVSGNVIDNTAAANTAFISLVGSGVQDLSGSGASLTDLNINQGVGGLVVLLNNFTIVNGQFTGSGTITGSTGAENLIFSGSDTANYSGTLQNLTLNATYPNIVTLSQNLNVLGNLTITALAGMNGTGTLKVSGNVIDNTAAANTAFISLVGSGVQDLSGSGASLTDLNINQGAGGSVVLLNNFTLVNGQLTGSGTVTGSTGAENLIFSGSSTVNYSGTLQNLTLNASYPNIVTLSQNLNVLGNLTITALAGMNGTGTLKVSGNVIDNAAAANTAFISLVGSGVQDLSGSGASLTDLNINQGAGGSVVLLNNFTLVNGQLTGSGTVTGSTGAENLIFSGSSTVNYSGTLQNLTLNASYPNIVTLSQNLSVLGNLTITALAGMNGTGTLKVSGNVIDNTAAANTGFISLVGSTDQTLSGSGSLYNLDISKPAGNILMSSFNKSFNQITVSAGQWDVLGNTVAAANGFIAQGGKITGTGMLTGASGGAGTVTVNSGGTLGGALTVKANVTANNGGTIRAGNPIGTLTINGNLAMASGSTLYEQVAGSTFDQVAVNGTVALSSPTLAGVTSSAPASPITIIANDLTDPVSGTFSGLAANSLVTLGGEEYRIVYNGDTGNDIVLTPVAATLTLNTTNPSVTVTAGQVASNSGIYSDLTTGSIVTITASVGTITQNTLARTWTWSLPTSAATTGPITVTITATDNFNATVTNTFTLQIDQPPTIASNNATVTGPEGSTITNTGTFNDPDGNATDTLTANVGTVTQNNTNGTWSWSLLGTATTTTPVPVTITATDSFSATATTSFTYSLTSVPRAITLTGASNVNEGSTYTLNLGAATEPITQSISSYSINWGDGTTDALSGDPSNSFATHVYAAGPASETISVSLTDGEGTYNNLATLPVTVNHVPPTVQISSTGTASEGTPYTLNLGSVTAPGPLSLSSYSINWGDGYVDHFTGSPDSTTASHTYASGPNAYTIGVSLSDDYGSYTNVATQAVTVNSVAPKLTVASASISTAYGATAKETGTFSEPGSHTIRLSASVGTITGHGSWTWTQSNATASGLVTITATNEQGQVSTTTFYDSVGQTHNFTVSNLGDAGTLGDLRYAITQARQLSNATIVFSSGLTGTITLGSALPSLDGNITLAGPGAGQLSVARSATASTAFPIFTVDPGQSATIVGLTLTNGSATNGGGIYNHNGSLNVAACTFTDDIATVAGGAIFNQIDGGGWTAALSFINDTFELNSAPAGAGIATSASGASNNITETLNLNTFVHGPGIDEPTPDAMDPTPTISHQDESTVVSFAGTGNGTFTLNDTDVTPWTTFAVNGTSGADAIGINATAITLGNESVTYNNAPSVTVNTGAGVDTVTATAAAPYIASNPSVALPVAVVAGDAGDSFALNTVSDFNGALALSNFGSVGLQVGGSMNGSVTSDGAIATANITSDFNGNLSAASFGGITIGGTVASVITSTNALANLTAGSISSAGSVNAGSIGTLVLTGNLAGSVSAANPGSIGTLSVGGSIDGTVTAVETRGVTGSGVISLLQASQVGSTGVIDAGTISAVNVTGNIAGTINTEGAGVIASFIVGEVTGMVTASEDVEFNGGVISSSGGSPSSALQIALQRLTSNQVVYDVNAKAAYTISGVNITKYDLAGDILWTTAVSRSSVTLSRIALDPNGDVVAIGTDVSTSYNGLWLFRLNSSGSQTASVGYQFSSAGGTGVASQLASLTINPVTRELFVSFAAFVKMTPTARTVNNGAGTSVGWISSDFKTSQFKNVNSDRTAAQTLQNSTAVSSDGSVYYAAYSATINANLGVAVGLFGQGGTTMSGLETGIYGSSGNDSITSGVEDLQYNPATQVLAVDLLSNQNTYSASAFPKATPVYRYADAIGTGKASFGDSNNVAVEGLRATFSLDSDNLPTSFGAVPNGGAVTATTSDPATAIAAQQSKIVNDLLAGTPQLSTLISAGGPGTVAVDNTGGYKISGSSIIYYGTHGAFVGQVVADTDPKAVLTWIARRPGETVAVGSDSAGAFLVRLASITSTPTLIRLPGLTSVTSVSVASDGTVYVSGTFTNSLTLAGTKLTASGAESCVVAIGSNNAIKWVIDGGAGAPYASVNPSDPTVFYTASATTSLKVDVRQRRASDGGLNWDTSATIAAAPPAGQTRTPIFGITVSLGGSINVFGTFNQSITAGGLTATAAKENTYQMALNPTGAVLSLTNAGAGNQSSLYLGAVTAVGVASTGTIGTLVTQATPGTVAVGSDAAVYTATSSGNDALGSNFIITKTTASGVASTFYTYNRNDAANANFRNAVVRGITVDRNGDLYIVGTRVYTNPKPANAAATSTYPSYNVAFLVKVAANGTVTFVNLSRNNSGAGSQYSVKISASNNAQYAEAYSNANGIALTLTAIVITGDFTGTAAYAAPGDATGNTKSTYSSPNSTSSYLLMLDKSSLQEIWSSTTTNANTNSGVAAVADASGNNAYVASTLAGHMAVTEYSQTGVVLWTKSDTSTGASSALGLYLDAKGNVWLQGYATTAPVFGTAQTTAFSGAANHLVRVGFSPNGVAAGGIDLGLATGLGSINGVVNGATIENALIRGDVNGTITAAGAGQIGNVEIDGNLNGAVAAVPDTNAGSGTFGSISVGGTLNGTVSATTLTSATFGQVSPTANVSGGTDVIVGEGATALNAGPLTGLFGTPATLSSSLGSVTYDGNGNWKWTFIASNGAMPATPVVISATDTFGNSFTVTFNVTVTVVPPTIAITGPATVQVNNPYTLAFGAIDNPSGLAISAYAVDWGDGVVQNFTGSPAATGAHTYTYGPVNNTITVWLTNSDGAVVGSTHSVGINNAIPVITSNAGGATAGVSIPQHTTAVTTVTGTDADTGQTLTYSIAGGADAGQFTIASSGALAFATPPDFEHPTDAGRVNVYNVTVQVSDGFGGTTTQALAITVLDTLATPAVTVNPVTIPVGAALANSQLTGTASVLVGGNPVTVPGTFTYTSAAGTVLNAGNGQSASVTFTPADPLEYATTTSTVTINVGKMTPTISWSNPASIQYGTLLSGAQLNATANVPGTFSYSIPIGTKLSPGTQTLQVTFTPTDTTDYGTMTATTSITVTPPQNTLTLGTPTLSSKRGQAITFNQSVSILSSVNVSSFIVTISSAANAANAVLTGVTGPGASFTSLGNGSWSVSFTASTNVSLTLAFSDPLNVALGDVASGLH